MLAGNGNVQRKIYKVTDEDTAIDSIHIDGTVDVRFTQTQGESNEFKIEAETDENLYRTDSIQISVNYSNNCLSVKDHNCQDQIYYSFDVQKAHISFQSLGFS